MSESKLDKFALYMIRNPDILVFMWFINLLFLTFNFVSGNISLTKSVVFMNILSFAIVVYLKLGYEQLNKGDKYE